MKKLSSCTYEAFVLEQKNGDLTREGITFGILGLVLFIKYQMGD